MWRKHTGGAGNTMVTIPRQGCCSAVWHVPKRVAHNSGLGMLPFSITVLGFLYFGSLCGDTTVCVKHVLWWVVLPSSVLSCRGMSCGVGGWVTCFVVPRCGQATRRHKPCASTCRLSVSVDWIRMVAAADVGLTSAQPSPAQRPPESRPAACRVCVSGAVSSLCNLFATVLARLLLLFWVGVPACSRSPALLA